MALIIFLISSIAFIYCYEMQDEEANYRYLEEAYKLNEEVRKNGNI